MGDLRVVYATHPKMPNSWDTRARGRRVHLAKKRPKHGRWWTLCNLVVVNLADPYYGQVTCKMCLGIIRRTDEVSQAIIGFEERGRHA